MNGIGGIAAFVQEVSRSMGTARPEGTAGVEAQRVAQQLPPEKRLMEVPATPPSGNLPRGSMLDLRA